MKRIDRRRVKTITEQATRNALKKQQLNEWGRVGALIGKGASALWRGGRNFVAGAGSGLGGRMGRMFGNGSKRMTQLAQRRLPIALQAQRDLGALKPLTKGQMAKVAEYQRVIPGNPVIRFDPKMERLIAKQGRYDRAVGAAEKSVERYEQALAQAQRLSRNKNLFRGGLLGGLGTYGLMTSFGGGGGSAGQSQYPYNELNGGPADPYADYYNGGSADPYAGYYSGGYADPYAGYYSGGYADPYAAYYSGYDPYAAYYSGGYSAPSTGGGSSSNPQDLAALMMLANQNGSGGNSGGMDLATMMALSGGNMDPAMAMYFGGNSGGMDLATMMALSGGNMNPNDIWGLGGYA